MRSHQLRHRVAIQRASETRDAHGSVKRTWTTVDTVWAEVVPMKGMEDDGEVPENTEQYRIRIRHYPGLTTQDRILLL